MRSSKGLFFLLMFSQLIFILSLESSAANNRPAWLISSDEIPKGWTVSTETVINDIRYYISFLNSKEDTGFSVETIQFDNTSEAQNYVIEEYSEWNQSDQLLYVFPQDKIDLSPVDIGVNWEVKSACCYSRGVLFSIEEIYIYIFGSQQASWTEIELLYNIQVIKILNFLDRDIPSNLISHTTEQSINSWLIALTVSSLITAVYITRKKP
ncbi:MAG: hypothetical protein ACFFFH_18515 [Candidatus Thorarchaeota archaeon]